MDHAFWGHTAWRSHLCRRMLALLELSTWRSLADERVCAEFRSRWRRRTERICSGCGRLVVGCALSFEVLEHRAVLLSEAGSTCIAHRLFQPLLAQEVPEATEEDAEPPPPQTRRLRRASVRSIVLLCLFLFPFRSDCLRVCCRHTWCRTRAPRAWGMSVGGCARSRCFVREYHSSMGFGHSCRARLRKHFLWQPCRVRTDLGLHMSCHRSSNTDITYRFGELLRAGAYEAKPPVLSHLVAPWWHPAERARSGRFNR